MEGGVPLKYKFLLAMVLDAANGSVGGVNKIPRCSGDTGRGNKEEIMQAIRITQYIFGVGSVYTASEALKEIL